MPQLSDQELQDWIEELHEAELKQVLKYLILLNADAVENAMSYVRRGQRNSFRGGNRATMSSSMTASISTGRAAVFSKS